MSRANLFLAAFCATLPCLGFSANYQAGDGADAGSYPGATAVGENASATFNSATAVGSGAVALDHRATAVGKEAEAGADQATAVGYKASAQGNSSTAVGYGASTTADSAVAVELYLRLHNRQPHLGTARKPMEAALRLSEAVRLPAIMRLQWVKIRKPQLTELPPSVNMQMPVVVERSRMVSNRQQLQTTRRPLVNEAVSQPSTVRRWEVKRKFPLRVGSP